MHDYTHALYHLPARLNPHGTSTYLAMGHWIANKKLWNFDQLNYVTGGGSRTIGGPELLLGLLKAWNVSMGNCLQGQLQGTLVSTTQLRPGLLPLATVHHKKINPLGYNSTPTMWRMAAHTHTHTYIPTPTHIRFSHGLMNKVYNWAIANEYRVVIWALKLDMYSCYSLTGVYANGLLLLYLKTLVSILQILV